MKFKDLKGGDIIHSFDTDNITYSKLTVSNVSAPRIDAKVIDGTVVDVDLDNQKTLVFKSEEISGTRANVFYTTNFNLLLDKIKSISNSIQDKLNEIERLKNTKKLCDKLLADLDPDIKERQKSERRLSDVEYRLSNLTTDITEIKEYLKKIYDNKVS